MMHLWQDQLQQYTATCRKTRPLPARAELSAEEEQRRGHIGGSFYAWLQQELPVILRRREELRQTIPFTETPLVVMTTEMSGLVAAHELLNLPSPEIVCLLEEEYRSWLAEHPDAQYLTHLHYWNYFRHPDAAESAAITHDFGPGDFRCHVIGCLWGTSMGMESTHLWEWDGAQLHLRREGLRRMEY